MLTTRHGFQLSHHCISLLNSLFFPSQLTSTCSKTNWCPLSTQLIIHMTSHKPSKHNMWFPYDFAECSFAGHDFGVAFRFVTRARARRRPPPVITKFKALGLGIAVGSFQKTVSGIDLGKVLTILVGVLEVWNMNFIFPYIGKNHPNWLSYFYIFFRGLFQVLYT